MALSILRNHKDHLLSQPNSTSGTQELDKVLCCIIKTDIISLLSVLSNECCRKRTTLPFLKLGRTEAVTLNLQ